MTETYILKLAIDDSAVKDLEKRLQGLMGIGGGSSGGGGNTDQTNIVKNITKLGIIAVGVGGLVELVKKIAQMTISASPMLQAMLKLLDTSITLILRPIGDFIGFALRPIMIYLLQYIALPFYRYFMPWMQRYGDMFGRVITGWLSPLTGKAKFDTSTQASTANTIVLSLSPIALSQMFGNWIKDQLGNVDLGKMFTDSISIYVQKWGNLAKMISLGFDKAWTFLTSLFDGISSGIKPLVSAWDKLWSFFTNIGKQIQPIQDTWDFLVTLFQSIGSSIQSVFVKAWDKLYAFFQMIVDFFKDPLGVISKALFGNQPSTAASSNTNTLTNAGTNIEHLVVQVSTEMGKDFADFAKDPLGYINKAIQTSLSRYGKTGR